MIHYQDERVTLHHANCLDVLAGMDDNSVNSIVTDPPYGLSNTDPKHVTETIGRWVAGDRAYVPEGNGFMGAKWDAFVPPPAVWDQCLRVLKPGGHALVFSSSRTTDLMTLSLRLAGFEIRDSIAWVFGGAMPKSLDVGKAIDREAKAERKVTGPPPYTRGRAGQSYTETRRVSYDYPPQPVTAPATAAAKQWDGWGTGLRPSMELVCVARKPIPRTVAACVQEWGTGAIHVDACRIGTTEKLLPGGSKGSLPGDSRLGASLGMYQGGVPNTYSQNTAGRWPPNVVLDDTTATQLDKETGISSSPATPVRQGGKKSVGGIMNATGADRNGEGIGYGDTGGSSRFFPVMKYQAKAPQKERPSYTDATGRKIAHSTVKPLTLMRWLTKLVTQPGGLIIDPFAGSGTTLEAAILEGFRCIGVEQDASYLPLIMTRIQRANNVPTDTGMFEAQTPVKKGRWPANVAMDKDTAAALDEETGILHRAAPYVQQTTVKGDVYNLGSLNDKHGKMSTHHGDTGGGSRFFAVFDTDDPPLFDIDEAI